MILPPNEATLLAWTVWQESQGEPLKGQQAVAHVILNRRKLAGYGNTICGVVMQPYQFSCWNSDSPTRRRLPEDNVAWRQAAMATESALRGDQDPTNGATNYLNEVTVKRVAGRLPAWFDASKVTLREGNHTFLKLV